MTRWVRLERGEPVDYRIFRARRDRYCFGAVEADVAVLEAPPWTNVIALTPAEEVVLVRQFRFGTEEVTLEIPGGAVDPGEDPLAAAVRELREETGYVGTDARVLGVVTPNPAFLTNRCTTVLVTGARPVTRPTPEPTEVLAVELRPLAEIPALLRAGRIHHALVVAAFAWLALERDDLF